MPRKLRVSVDYDKCTGVGACEQVCPEVFFMNDEGLPDVLEEEPHETLWAAVERAEEACPEEAVDPGVGGGVGRAAGCSQPATSASSSAGGAATT